MPVTNYFSANGRLLGENGPNGRVDYLTDALGSVTTTLNGSGAVLNQYRYKPSGAPSQKRELPPIRNLHGLDRRDTGRLG